MAEGIAEYTAFRVMKENLPENVWIRGEVKTEMTNLLNNIIISICEKLPSDTNEVTYKDFAEAAKTYLEIVNEKGSKQLDEKHIKYIEKIITDCETIKNDLENKWGE